MEHRKGIHGLRNLMADAEGVSVSGLNLINYTGEKDANYEKVKADLLVLIDEMVVSLNEIKDTITILNKPLS